MWRHLCFNITAYYCRRINENIFNGLKTSFEDSFLVALLLNTILVEPIFSFMHFLRPQCVLLVLTI
jgi:hypothetical protein